MYLASFIDPPQPLKNPIDLFGFSIGRAGNITVEFQANPRPTTLQWVVRNQIINEGGTDQAGRIEAERLIDLVSRISFPVYFTLFTLFTGTNDINLRFELHNLSFK